MNIVVLDALTLGNVDLTCMNELGNVIVYDRTSKEEVTERILEANVIITNKVVIGKDEMRLAGRLKLICIAATGMNNVDLEYAQENDILVKNVTNYSTKSVTTHTFSMLFQLLCSSNYYSNYVKSGEYEKSTIFTHLGREFSELSDKTWGIIGLGNIGKEIAKIASAFGCNIVYYSTSGNNTNRVYDRVPLHELLAKSDIVSIHSPLNENTKNLIATKELELMKDNAILLNLGRGGIVNEKNLVDTLQHKKLCVGLDVLEAEPISATSPIKDILDLDNVYVTPHIAWASKEAREKLVEKIKNNIIGVFT